MLERVEGAPESLPFVERHFRRGSGTVQDLPFDSDTLRGLADRVKRAISRSSPGRDPFDLPGWITDA